MPLPLVYHPEYSPPFPGEHRFPMEKFRLLHEHLAHTGLLDRCQLYQPQLPSQAQLARAHCPEYIQRYMNGTLAPEQLRRLGLPWSQALAQRTVRAVGGSLLTAELALQHGMACHLAGGTHHAHFDYPAGFCIFNDLAIVALELLHTGRAQRVLIIDCDVHQGDGTARILADVPEAITVSLHCEKNYPARKALSDWDIGLPMGMGDADYLHTLEQALDYLLPLTQPDFIVYDAGADVHQHDALGYLKLTDHGLHARDRLVFTRAVQAQIPIMAVIGGGYDRDRHALARRHGIVHHCAAEVWRDCALG
ncbi:histone deacetylase family protein [Atopomonas sediminilitoris]|uniref:histone deacetylase family protein n=1 Tax=Atopomonas sediminilitoris TaxID=2919919 RepID=UPI001F4ECDCD|nr:histone deacetylase [Atopomonas sediminilitoris]MCJ8168471.1 histone deacetylase [Atopomonas sediminilitoris]